MFNSIRAHQYLNDFMKLIELYYKFEYRIILSNYYLFDWRTSIYDKDILTYGSYERIGDLTGYKWIKIYNFPVAFTQQMIPKTNPTQYGVNKETETQSVFPKINFTPSMLDFITFDLQNQEIDSYYQVSSFEMSYIGNITPIYKVTLKLQAFNFDEVMSQVSGEYSYNEIFDKIYEVSDHNDIMTATAMLQSVASNLQKYKENSSGFIMLKE